MSQYGTLEDCLQTIENAQFGEEVRKAIVEAIRFAAESGGGGGGGSITFDNAISDTSENAVQNKVIYRSINNMVGRNQNLVNGEIINAAGTNVITSSGKVIGGNYFLESNDNTQNEKRVATELGVLNLLVSRGYTSANEVINVVNERLAQELINYYNEEGTENYVINLIKNNIYINVSGDVYELIFENPNTQEEIVLGTIDLK